MTNRVKNKRKGQDEETTPNSSTRDGEQRGDQALGGADGRSETSEESPILSLVTVMQQQIQLQNQQIQEEREFRRLAAIEAEKRAEEERQRRLEKEALREENKMKELMEAEKKQEEERIREENRRLDAKEAERRHELKLKELETRLAEMAARTETERIKELQQSREVAKEERGRREVREELKEQAKAVPTPKAMKDESDIQDYLEMYEETQTKKMISKKNWGTHVYPLLNDNYRAIALTLTPKDRETYSTLKEALLKAATCSSQQAAQQMWDLRRAPDMTPRAWAGRVKRSVTKMWQDKDPNTLAENVALEKFIRSYPREISNKVRDFNPSTVDEAADLVTRFNANTSDQRNRQKAEEHGQKKGHQKTPKETWRKYSSYSKPGVEEGKAESTQGTPSQVADHKNADPGKDNSNHKKGHNHKQSGNNKNKPETICRRCGGRGHWEKDCPSAPSSVNWVRLDGMQEDTREGALNGVKVQDILIDAGSAASIIAEDMLPEDAVLEGATWLAGFDAEPKQYQTTQVNLTIEGQELKMRMAVVPRDSLRGRSALLGRDIPGWKWTQVFERRQEPER